MKYLLIILLLVSPCYGGNPTSGGGSYKGKEVFDNAICLKVERVYKIYNRSVRCSSDNGNYSMQIWSNREIEKIDFYMARAIFYDAAKTYNLMQPKSLRVSNNYGVSNKRTLNDLVREFGK